MRNIIGRVRKKNCCNYMSQYSGKHYKDERMRVDWRKGMSVQKIQYCKRCVMNDTADKFITFDEQGFCNYCTAALAAINTTTYFPNEEGQKKLTTMISTIKKENKDKPYDCVMGISGGLDSAYLAYLGYKWGLRILAVHIDDGYDTEISKKNIKKLCRAAHIELYTITPDEEQFNNLTLAYMKAGVPNLAIPQDNILFAFLYETVIKEKLKYFSKYGSEPIDKLKFVSSYQKFWNTITGRVIQFRPLNYIEYNRKRAFEELYEFCGFEYYGRKHLENILTAFVQLYWFPKKFGVDKRSSHLSSMIVSGQMTRDEAMRQLAEPLYDAQMMNNYVRFIKEKLQLSDEEFDEIMKMPVHEHEDFKVDKFAKIIRKFIKRS